MKTIMTILLLFQTCLGLSQSEELKDDGRTIMIPVVFHIVSINSDEEVSKAITTKFIKKEIEDLNQNYSASNDISLLHPDYKAPIGNPNVQFYLADVNGKNGEKGVFRTVGKNKHNTHRRINSSKHLNICIGDFDTVTQMSSARSHKVHINYERIGKGTNSVTHELGHYFGLWHVWGKSNCRKIKILSSKNDDISDTPRQKNCTDLSRKKSYPKILTEKNINFNNFMDYSGFRMMFTDEQVAAMRNNIINHRPEMYKNSL